MNKERILQEIGFSNAESKVYLALLSSGETKAGFLIKKTGLQSSVVHNSLNGLSEKGFASYVLKGKVKRYFALEPKLIERYIAAKKESFAQILPELEAIKSRRKDEITTAEVYEGYNGFFAATLNLLNDAKKGDIYKYFAMGESMIKANALEFFTKVDRIKKEKGIVVKGISDLSAKQALKKYESSELRFVEQKIPPAMNIFNDKIIIMSFSEKPVAILINSKEIAKQYHELWDDLWKHAKKFK